MARVHLLLFGCTCVGTCARPTRGLHRGSFSRSSEEARAFHELVLSYE